MRVTPDEQDYGWMVESKALAYAGSAAVWDEDMMANHMRSSEGIIGVDRTNRLFGELFVRERPAIFGIINAGISTHVVDLIPQHHSQKHIDEKICPLLADLCRDTRDKWPEALNEPVWAFVAHDLAIPFWRDSIVKTIVIPSRSGGNALAYVPTLALIIQRLEAAGL